MDTPADVTEVRFECPECGQHIICDDSLRGTQVKCPSCGSAVADLQGVPVSAETGPPVPPVLTPPSQDAADPMSACAVEVRRSRRFVIGASIAACSLTVYWAGIALTPRFNLLESEAFFFCSLFSVPSFCVGLGLMAVSKGRSPSWGAYGLLSLLIFAPAGVIIAPVGQVMAVLMILVLKRLSPRLL